MKILLIYPNGNALNNHSGAGVRAYSIIENLIKHNMDVYVLHSLDSKGHENLKLKKNLNVYYHRKLSYKGKSLHYLSDLNPFYIFKIIKIKKNIKPDIIHLEFPWGFFIIKFFTNKRTKIIYDSLGVEKEFIKVSIKNPNFPKILAPIGKIFCLLYEKMVCKLADVIINVSNVDRTYYIDNYNVKREKTYLIQIPSSLKIKDKEMINKFKYISRKKLKLPMDKTIVIFHGGSSHPPNQEAFKLIKNYIAPHINNPKIIFVLAGTNLKRFRKNNIVSLGFVEDLKVLLFSADFAIIPIISGSGMRVKCSDYIEASLPFVATKKAVEGIDFLEDKKNCLIYDKVNIDFINGINYLSRNKELRQKLRSNLLKKPKTLDHRYNENKLIALYSKLFNNNS